MMFNKLVPASGIKATTAILIGAGGSKDEQLAGEEFVPMHSCSFESGEAAAAVASSRVKGRDC